MSKNKKDKKASGDQVPAEAAEATTAAAGAGDESGASSANNVVNGGFKARFDDPRVPPAGTVIQKKDRLGNVRAECTILADGVEYNGQKYSSLSAASMAAAKALGLKSKTQNGFTFWGLESRKGKGGGTTRVGTGRKVDVAASSASGIAALEKELERAYQRASVEMEKPLGSAHRAGVKAALAQHVQKLGNFIGEFDGALTAALAKFSGATQPTA